MRTESQAIRPSELDTYLAALRAATVRERLRERERERQQSAQEPARFVTISRQAGAGGRSLGRRLVERLNAAQRLERPWACWDRELLEKVAADHHVSKSLIEAAMDGPGRTWFQQLMASLPWAHAPGEGGSLDEYQIYRRVAQTVRALASAGRVVIVGRGSVYATADMPGGVHVRLIAPLEHRIRHMMRLNHLSREQAEQYVSRHDREREVFHRRYWPTDALLPEIFTLTLNAAAIPEDSLVECVLPLLAPDGSDAAAAGAARPASEGQLETQTTAGYCVSHG